ncbi:hypothetical protein [Psychrobacillus lasiicapitis]|uniref:DUF3221 domain-containing protein n=1 Tax=Psychrobacillus lasiicapitis TaxID=1636719 RepID=A0A544TAR2_9BACI|nr:hypothetical protein [Psychrobacillus lasiicapitis]TQR14560.1 hypothetical protein FG382_08905 [Psychrobacillus lasiicapitis]GGA30367.1 hypothetical protein GCM10011384_19720 [Psychrobacillus lasiicapitis]
MKKVIMSLMIVACSIYLIGCTSSETEEVIVSKNPNAEEVLGLDPHADIFQWDGIIYQTNIEWVNEMDLTKDELVGEIEVVYDNNLNFKDRMANKLPIGARIFSTKERKDILLVEYAGKNKKYLALGEG